MVARAIARFGVSGTHYVLTQFIGKSGRIALTIMHKSELLRIPQHSEHIILARFQISPSPSPVDSERKIRPERHEQRHGEDLPHQASDHNVLAADGSGVSAGCGCDAPACTLEDECEEIATDEDVGVGAGKQSGELGTVDRDET